MNLKQTEEKKGKELSVHVGGPCVYDDLTTTILR